MRQEGLWTCSALRLWASPVRFRHPLPSNRVRQYARCFLQDRLHHPKGSSSTSCWSSGDNGWVCFRGLGGVDERSGTSKGRESMAPGERRNGDLTACPPAPPSP